MALAKVALDGKFVRLEPLEERHREAVRPAAQHPEIFTVTTSALGPLYDPYIDNALKRSDGTHDLAFAVLLKAGKRYVGMTRYLNIEEAHKKIDIGPTLRQPPARRGAGNAAHHKRVTPSRPAILTLGAIQEGIFRKHMIMADGHVRDSVYFSIVDTDWPAVKAGLGKRVDKTAYRHRTV